MDIILVVFWGLLSVFALICFFFFIEVLLSCFPRLRSRDETAHLSQTFLNKKAAIIIPAHNEENVIGETLGSLIPQLQQDDEIIVVADNCTDDTHNIASAFSVTVIERNNPENRGKGYALDFAVNHIKNKDFDVIIIIDADCIAEPSCRDRLVAKAMSSGRPIQCLYLMHGAKELPTIGQKISEFAWLIKNKLRPLGLLTMGGPCHLMGTGMAFPAKMLNETNLANGCIVEDMKLGLDLAIEGNPPLFLPEALVWSRFPDSEEVGNGQKSRWIHGHLEMISLYAPTLLKKSIVACDIYLLFLCFELLIPPLVFMLLISFALLVVSCVLALLVGSSIYLLSILSVLLIVGAVSLAWFSEGRSIISFGEILKGVFSRLKSSSVYLKFFTDRRKDWNKTSRK